MNHIDQHFAQAAGFAQDGQGSGCKSISTLIGAAFPVALRPASAGGSSRTTSFTTSLMSVLVSVRGNAALGEFVQALHGRSRIVRSLPDGRQVGGQGGCYGQSAAHPGRREPSSAISVYSPVTTISALFMSCATPCASSPTARIFSICTICDCVARTTASAFSASCRAAYRLPAGRLPVPSPQTSAAARPVDLALFGAPAQATRRKPHRGLSTRAETTWLA